MKRTIWIIKLIILSKENNLNYLLSFAITNIIISTNTEIVPAPIGNAAIKAISASEKTMLNII
jgi:hypothetical protein